MSIFFKKRSKARLEKFLKENNIKLEEKTLENLLQVMKYQKNVKFETVNNPEKFENLLCEKLVLDEEYREYLELEFNSPYLKAPYNVVPSVPNAYYNQTLVEKKVELVLGDDISKGKIYLKTSEKVEPKFNKEARYIILRYEKIYRWEKSNIIVNPTLYFYNF